MFYLEKLGVTPRDSEVFLRRGVYPPGCQEFKGCPARDGKAGRTPGLPSGPVSAPSRLHGRSRSCLSLPDTRPLLAAVSGPVCFPTLLQHGPHHASSGSSLELLSACFLLPCALCSPGRGCLGFLCLLLQTTFPTSLPALSPQNTWGPISQSSGLSGIAGSTWPTFWSVHRKD